METSFFVTPALPSVVQTAWQATVAQSAGIPYLLPYQELVIFHLLTALGLLPGTEDTYENILCLFPTGMGKSVCFMGPLGALKGFGIVVYPLNALLSDQERRFTLTGIPCFVLKGGQNKEFREEGLRRLLTEGRGVVLTNPETLQSPGVRTFWEQLPAQVLVVDEVHLVASWGEDFRPQFRELGHFRQRHKIPVLAAFSATVPDAQLPILFESLFLDEPPLIIRAPMDRPNLSFLVVPSVSPEIFAPWLYTPWARIFGIEPLAQPSILFCSTRNLTEDTAFSLKRFFRFAERDVEPKEILYYHAGLDPKKRRQLEQEFFKMDKGIMLATCAYGLGIDKPNVRSVLHLFGPENPESYIQESGRGGRDGKKARALLFVNPDSENPKWVKEYGANGQCRKQWLVRSLGEDLEGCSGCDSCEGMAHRLRLEDQVILQSVRLFGLRRVRRSLYSCIKSFRPSKKAEDVFYYTLTRDLGQEILQRWLESALKRDVFA